MHVRVCACFLSSLSLSSSSFFLFLLLSLYLYLLVPQIGVWDYYSGVETVMWVDATITPHRVINCSLYRTAANETPADVMQSFQGSLLMGGGM